MPVNFLRHEGEKDVLVGLLGASTPGVTHRRTNAIHWSVENVLLLLSRRCTIEHNALVFAVGPCKLDGGAHRLVKRVPAASFQQPDEVLRLGANAVLCQDRVPCLCLRHTQSFIHRGGAHLVWAKIQFCAHLRRKGRY